MSTDTQQFDDSDEADADLFRRLADRYQGTDMERVFEIYAESLSENEEANS